MRRALAKMAALLALIRTAGLSRASHPWLTIGAIGVAAVLAAWLLVVSGVVPIKASSGHWRITAKFLDFAKARSVTTYSWGIQSPPLDDPNLVLRGASHYESGCYACHGGPSGRIPPVMAAMTPVPPALSGRILRWKPEELFSIVKHGIKLTGMPAWPTQQRDDEVWAMVAFLRKLPDLDEAGYRRLVYGEQGAGAGGRAKVPPAGAGQPPIIVRDICWRCHGVNGTGRGTGAFPSLAGQRFEYLYAPLRAFATGNRFSGIMTAVSTNLSDRMMREAAEFYARLASRPPDPSRDLAAREHGRGISERGIPDRDIPSCADCHGPSDTPRNPGYPRLAGQHARYLALQLELFKARRRGGSGYENLMHVFVGRLGPQQIRDVTLYYASLEEPGSSAATLLSR